jgi:hypothetical protein
MNQNHSSRQTEGLSKNIELIRALHKNVAMVRTSVLCCRRSDGGSRYTYFFVPGGGHRWLQLSLASTQIEAVSGAPHGHIYLGGSFTFKQNFAYAEIVVYCRLKPLSPSDKGHSFVQNRIPFSQ